MEGANLHWTHLEGAYFFEAHLQGAHFREAHLEGAHFREAHLEGALLRGAHLDGTSLHNTHVEGSDLRGAFFTSATNLLGICLSNEKFGTASLGGVRWDDVELSVVDWTQVTILGDERQARQRRGDDGEMKQVPLRLHEYQAAVRANRKLAVALQGQGLSEEATRFAYQAQKLQRVVLRYRKKFAQYLFSSFLDVLAGYGYRPGRSVLWYLATIVVFALGYHVFGHLSLWPPDAFVYSLTSFHGRGFFPGLEGKLSLHDPLILFAAVEAVVGLVIEISFIATFTQRFFGK
jgi:Pentapeptide repeats (8 copies)